MYDVVLTVNDRADSSGLSSSDSLTIAVGNKPPVPTVVTPLAGSLYTGGAVINFSGTATDDEDGTLPASAYHWTFQLGHNTHFHDFISPIDGVTSGSFQIPTVSETDPDQFYRISLTVTDSGGISRTMYRDIRPRTTVLSLVSNLPESSIALDGEPVELPAYVTAIVGQDRLLSAPTRPVLDGVAYGFERWSDSGSATHNLSVPSAGGTYVATYRPLGAEVFLSDMNWTSGVTGYGTIHKDENIAGKPLKLNGVTYTKGLAVHANSEVVYPLNKAYTTFKADIGLDDEIGSNGTAVFQVWADGVKLYDSGLMTGSSATKQVLLDVAGRQELKLITTNGGDNIYYDHTDWADAKLTSTYLSDFILKSGSTGYGVITKDQNLAGHPIKLNGVTYSKGLAVHANSDLRYSLGGAFTTFSADIGLDDEIGSLGTASFQVWADGVKLYDSGAMTGASATKRVVLDVGGRQELQLVTLNGGDNISYDHTDWANAQLTSTYLTDLNPTLGTTGYGTITKDSNLAKKPIKLNEVVYGRGLATHANSEVRYNLGGKYAKFVSEIGLDDEIGTLGSAVFQIWADGTKLYESGVMNGTSPTQSVSVDVSGRQELRLITTNGGDNIYHDHTDWANARLIVDTIAPLVTATSPVNNATGVPVGSAVTAVMSEPMTPATVNAQTVQLTRQGTTGTIAATVTYNAATKNIVLTPSSALLNNSTYTATVRGGLNGVKDAAGNPLASDVVWTFKTPDTIAPTISNVQAVNISTTSARITWTTNEPATSQVEYGRSNKYGSITPLSPAYVTSHSVNLTGLRRGTTYHYRVRSTDAAGNLTVTLDFVFTTL